MITKRLIKQLNIHPSENNSKRGHKLLSRIPIQHPYCFQYEHCVLNIDIWPKKLHQEVLTKKSDEKPGYCGTSAK
jgi:hypothetical protein